MMTSRSTLTRIWIPLFSFLLTAVIATVQHWSAEELAWTFWLASLLWSVVYLVVFSFSQDMGVGWFYIFILFFFYFIFGSFIFGIFSMIQNDLSNGPPVYTCLVTGMIQGGLNAARHNWPFFIFSGIKVLPDYILDARTVHFTDVGKPLFTRDALRMYFLIFLLMAMYLLQLSQFAIYAILLIYFFPWSVLKLAWQGSD